MLLLNCSMIIIGRGLTSVECIWNLRRRYRGASWPSSYDSLRRYKHKVRDDLFACFLYICVAVSCDLLETRSLATRAFLSWSRCLRFLWRIVTFENVNPRCKLLCRIIFVQNPKIQYLEYFSVISIFSLSFFFTKNLCLQFFFQHSPCITKNQDQLYHN